MSGWIKFEKDLLTDPRVLRVAKSLAKRFALSEVTGENDIAQFGNDHALPAVTLVCGALARMWVLADTHIGSDSVLPLGCSELNDILGIPGFCELLPEDWLVVIDDDHVQLPEFHQHNGTEAKKKAVTQKRVERWRNKPNEEALQTRNGRALPDQDQTKTKTTESAAPPLVLHESLPTEAWGEWLAHRREKRWSMSPRALKPQLKLLSKFPTQIQREIIETSLQAGWQGLFEPKGKSQPAKADPFRGSH